MLMAFCQFRAPLQSWRHQTKTWVSLENRKGILMISKQPINIQCSIRDAPGIPHFSSSSHLLNFFLPHLHILSCLPETFSSFPRSFTSRVMSPVVSLHPLLFLHITYNSLKLFDLYDSFMSNSPQDYKLQKSRDMFYIFHISILSGT